MTDERLNRSLSVSKEVLDETLALAQSLHRTRGSALKDKTRPKSDKDKALEKPHLPLCAHKLSQTYGIPAACLIRAATFQGIWAVMITITAFLIVGRVMPRHSHLFVLSTLIAFGVLSGILVFYYLIFTARSKTSAGENSLFRYSFFLTAFLSFSETIILILQSWKLRDITPSYKMAFVHSALLWSGTSALITALYFIFCTEFWVRSRKRLKEQKSGAFPRRLSYAIVVGVVTWLVVFSHLLPPSLGWFPGYF